MSHYIGKRNGRPAKTLYLANSLQELEKKGLESVQDYIVNSEKRGLKLRSIMESLSLIDMAGADADRCNDEELFYLSIYKYIELFLRHRDCLDYQALKKDKTFSSKISEMEKKAVTFMERLEELKEPLKTRYSQRYPDQRIIINSTNCSLNENQPPHSNGLNSDVILQDEPAEVHDDSMDCTGLHNLLQNEKKNLFIIDVRPAAAFKECKIIADYQINIPEENIREGLSAQSLGSKMEGVNRLMWNKRGNFAQVVLVDSSSKLSSLDHKSPVAILKDIMDKWDMNTKYKSRVRILNGGLEELIWRYPAVVCNANKHVTLSLNNHTTDILDNLEYPMEVVETRKELEGLVPAVPRLSTPNYPSPPDLNHLHSRVSNIDIYNTIDRSKKPKISERVAVEAMEAEQQEETSNDIMDVTREETTQLQWGHPHPRASPPLSLQESKEREVEERESDKWVFGGGDKTSFLEELRKRKPLGGSVDPPPYPYQGSSGSVSSSDEECEPLKKDSNSNLKRSSSTPNLVKQDEYEPTKPSFSRSDKPVHSQKAHNLTQMYGDQIGATSGKTIPGLTGLKNFANNCYMNAILQCLSNTDELKKELLSLVSSPVRNKKSKTQGNIVKQVTESVRYMWSGDFKALSLRGLKEEISGYKEIFKGSQHQDCHEFLIILLEYLHDDLNTVGAAEVGTLLGANEQSGERAWGEFRNKNSSIIQRLFYGQDRSSVTCAVCRHESVTFGQFFNLFVPIPDNICRVSLDDCLQLYTSVENITGWTCPECKCHRSAQKKLDISKLPPILIIALKRFSQEGQGWGRSCLEKKDTAVSYPLESLDMSRYTSANSEQRYHRYDLYALSLHMGSLRGGHYYAICKNSHTNKWHKYDDTYVGSVSLSEARDNCDVYILFYRAVK